jgi:chromosome partitioning protein
MKTIAFGTLKDVFERGTSAHDVIHKSPISALPNLDIIPSSIHLTATEISMVNLAGRERLFNNFILDNRETLNEYDYILIDTNPNLGMINQNVFFAADSIVLISDISSNSIQGAEFFIALWESIRRQLRKLDNVAALILNNSDRRMNLPDELIGYIRENSELKELLLDTVIPSSIQVKNTELDHKPINILETSSKEALNRVKTAFQTIIQELTDKGVL